MTFSLGGPIIKDKLFFFANYEGDKTTAPGTSFTANPGGATVGGNMTRVLASDLNALSTFLKSSFGYDAGSYQGYDFETPGKRYLLKLDYNVDDKNKVTLRYNRLDSETPVLMSNSSSLGFGTRRSSTTGLNFTGSNYSILENSYSVVGEWNSILSNDMYNNLIVGYSYSDESRGDAGTLFPFVDILNSGSVYTSFGSEPFTPNNELRYSSWQVQDNFTWDLGTGHVLTFGFAGEKYHSENVFFPGKQSVYVYNSLQDFYTDAQGYLTNPNRTVSPVTLRSFQVRYNNIPGQEKPVQPLDVYYVGLYAQDEYQVTKDLKLTLGLRVDMPSFGGYAIRYALVYLAPILAGDKITFVTKVSDIFASPDKFNGKRVLVQGPIVDVCAEMGCWLAIGSDKEFQTIRFKVEDGVIVFPMSVKGMNAKVEGVLAVSLLSEADQIKQGEEMAREKKTTFDPKTVKGPKTSIQIKGEGAEVK